MQRTVIRIISIGALLGVVGWLVASKVAGDSGAAEQKKGSSGPKSVLVTTQPVREITLTDTLSTVGTLRASESIAIKNEVPGKVVDIGFTEGEEVRRGQTLLRMRSDTLRAELAVRQQRKKLLEKQVARQKKILQKGGLSQREYDVTFSELQVNEAEIDRIEAEIDKTLVRAPFSGVVGLRSVSPGAILTQGTTFATLQKLDPIEVEFSVPERHAGRVKREMEVRFRIHGTGKVHRATVHATDPHLDPSNRTLRVRARLANPDRALRPGSYAQVKVALQKIDGAVTIPTTALNTSGGETSVWVNAGGKAEKRVIQTGMRTENHVRITEGLSVGEEVVTTGRQSVRPGARLKIDDSDDAMNVEKIGPDPERPGMQNRWFSEESDESTGDGSEESQ